MTIIENYSSYNEAARMFTSKSKNIEYQTTIHFFDSIIPKESRILELGAGGGIYTEYLAKQNHSVLSSDIIPEYIDVIKTRCSSYKNVNVQKINALELNSLGNNQFDVILCMGPYYHLQNGAEREKVLYDCSNLLKKNGLLIVSYINKYFALPLYLMYGKKLTKKEYELYEHENYSELAHIDGFMGFSHYTTPDKIENEILKYRYKIENHIGVDGIYNLISEQIEKMNENEFSDFLNYHYKICSEKSTLGNSSHGLVFCRKE